VGRSGKLGGKKERRSKGRERVLSFFFFYKKGGNGALFFFLSFFLGRVLFVELKSRQALPLRSKERFCFAGSHRSFLHFVPECASWRRVAMSFEAARVGARGGFGGGGGGGGGGFGGGSSGGGGFGGGGGYQNEPYGSSGARDALGMDNFDDSVRRVQAGIMALSTKVGEIERLTGQLGSRDDSADLREDLRSRVMAAKQGAKTTTDLLRQLDTEVRDSGSPQRRMQQQKLMKDFQDWLHRYQDVSQLSAEKEREFPLQANTGGARSFGGGGGGGSLYDDDVNPEEHAARDAERIQVQQQSDFNSAIIEEREAGIRQIERTVQDVNDIFMDLGKLVDEQGTMIDNIESNIDETVQHVDSGVGEIRQASNYQKKARSKACWLALIILIAAGAVVGFVFLFKSK
jgi:Syntaxin-like protein/SNARE domain